MPYRDFDELGRRERELETTERDVSSAYAAIGRLGAEAVVEAVRVREAFRDLPARVLEASEFQETLRDLPARILEASDLQETLQSVTARLLEASELQEMLRSVTEMFNRETALETERLRALLQEIVDATNERYAAQVRELVRGVGRAATVQLSATLPSADMPVVTIPYRPRPAPAPAREVVYVPQELEEEGDLLKGIAEHPLVPLTSVLINLIMLAYVVADHHPHIFAWSIEQLLRTAEQLLGYMD
jgi:hypothetical protein